MTLNPRVPETRCRISLSPPSRVQASGSAKIDQLMASFNAIALIAMNPASTQPAIHWI
jgi:phage terminase large subunit-like protein